MRRVPRRLGGLAACIAGLHLAGSAAAEPAVTRTVTAREIVEWADIGVATNLGGGGSGLTLSPDGRRFSFEVHRADVDADTYRSDWLIGEVGGTAAPRPVGDGGDPTLFRSGQGSWISAQAKWSPDGSRIAYRRKADGQVQVWTSRADGSAQARVTASAADVVDFAWSPDGRSILFETDAPRAEIAAVEAREARQGYRVDDNTFNGFYSVKPLQPPYRLTGGKPLYWSVSLADGTERPATQAEVDAFAALGEPATVAGRPGAVQVLADRSGGRLAWLENPRPDVFRGAFAPLTVAAAGKRPGAPAIMCRAQECTGLITNLGWSDRGEVLFLARGIEGRTLFVWSPDGGRVRRVHATQRQLSSCASAGARVLCLEEGPASPRRVVAIDVRSGALSVLADPNPGFDRYRLGEVERLTWTNAFGVTTAGFLVKPVGYEPGRRYPLVIVQYNAEDCLRGGTGAEFPTHLFSAHGMAVLCMSEPTANRALYEREADPMAVFRGDYRDMIRQRNIQSSIETVIAQLSARGLVDERRVGLTGLSAGVEAVQYMLIHSKAIAAAATAGGGVDTMSYYGSVGWSRRGLMVPLGWGDPTKPSESGGWREVSLSLNADHIDVPLLIQAASTEYLSSALQIAVTWREAGKPIDVYVFPDEFHVKWSPAHRLAVYQRNLDWFRFWLLGEEDADPSRAEQYAEWRRLRAARTAMPGK